MTNYNYPDSTQAYHSNHMVICNSWYWVWTANGERLKHCALAYTCPKGATCGMLAEHES